MPLPDPPGTGKADEDEEFEGGLVSKLVDDTYLGDGVYASFDGYHIILDLRGQDPTFPITKIALEPVVMEALDNYRRQIQLAIEEAQNARPLTFFAK